MQFLNFDDISITKKMPNLLKYLPNYYQKSEVAKNVLDAHAYEVGLLDLQIDDIRAQLNVETATWGLVYYERTYGIKPNPTDSIQNRREVVTAKMRGQGTITKTMIKLTAEAFSGGEVEIIEHNDEDYFVIYFVGRYGIPENMADLLAIIDEIVPAHLGYEVEYRFKIWGEAKEFDWGELRAFTWSEFLNGEIFHNDYKTYKIATENGILIATENGELIATDERSELYHG